MIQPEKLPGMRPITLESVKEKDKTDRLLPTRDQFRNLPGYWEKPNGKWGCKIKTNEHGKLTREGALLVDVMKPYARASVERVAGHNGFPGDWGGRGTRTDAHRDGSPARVTNFATDFCENCDRLKVWCDCECYP